MFLLSMGYKRRYTNDVEFVNAYDDAKRAEAYSALEFPGTYYLAYRDLPEIILARARGRRALDFGCGAGRSTRFLRELGFDAVGVDISGEMIMRARGLDPDGDYRLIESGSLAELDATGFDLVLSAFTFDNIPTMNEKVRLFTEIRRLLIRDGILVNLASSPDMYVHEWASFSTRDFPENKQAQAGDTVRIIITAVDDNRPVEDIVWPDENYREAYRRAGLTVAEMRKPLARQDEPYEWVNETRVAPWVIYVLSRT
jgi:SAM-dependent methyltransferase